MARPSGSRNTQPSKKAIAGYFRLLADAADKGDVNAAAELIKIDHMTNQRAQRMEHTQS